MGKQEEKGILSNLATYSSSQYLAQALNFVRGILIARFLPPEVFGIYALAILATMYGPYISLGIPFAASVRYSQLRGEGQPAALTELRQATLGFLLIFCLGLLVMGIGGAVYFWTVGSEQIAYAFLGVPLIVLAQQVQQYQINYWRAANRFGRVAGSNLLIAVVSLLLVAVAGEYFGIFAAYGSLFLGTLLAIFMNTSAREILDPRLDFSLIRSVLKPALGLLIFNLLVLVYASVDRVVVANFFTEEEMGHFNFAFYLANGVSLLPLSLVTVAFPRILQDLSENKTPGYFKDLLWKLTFYSTVFIAAVYVMLVAAGDFLIPDFLPQYDQSRDFLLPLGALFCTTLMLTNYDTYLLGRKRFGFLIGVLSVACLGRFGIEYFCLGYLGLELTETIFWVALWGFGIGLVNFTATQRLLKTRVRERWGSALLFGLTATPVLVLSFLSEDRSYLILTTALIFYGVFGSLVAWNRDRPRVYRVLAKLGLK